ncbi:MAG: VOC family protein [Candidatus Dadabacteria bacterium]|nr:VOC family protein [Candidatus Dadabacteria bacterium]
MPEHEKIDYVEFPSKDFAETKKFFVSVFGWEFTDWSENYISFSKESAGLEGGFYKSDLMARADKGGALVVFYSENLEETQRKVIKSGGEIVNPVFSFPSGRRFHFADPCGNEYAVWSDK